MRHFSRALVLVVLSWAFTALSASPPPSYRFKAEVLHQSMNQPMELEVAPDGRVFFNEIGGRLKIWQPSSGEVVLAATIAVFAEQENGFLGFALDPGFASNQWIYLFYSPKDLTGQRLSRFLLEGDQVDLTSEKVMLEFGEQRRDCCHHAGSVEFGPEGDLYISTGDNTHPAGDSDGYAPIDERPDRGPFDAQKSSANTHDLRGKILRIRPTAAGGYTIPAGNLFPADGSQGRPEIFVMGCRNPWRLSVDERTGIIYWGEVGPDAGGDGARGSRGYDEINQARQAGNYGWPYFVGNNFAYTDYDFATKKNGAHYDPRAPVNESPNNTGSRILPPAQPAFIYWPYGESKEFPILGGGGRTACAGPVFHYAPEFEKTGGFPSYFDNCLLFYDWQRPFMKWARLDADSRLVTIESFPDVVRLINDKPRIAEAERAGHFVIRRPVDMQFARDGRLYIIDYGETWGPNVDAKLLRISYLWGNLAPVAVASSDVKAGREPLAVRLSAKGSRDLEDDPVRLEWRLHPGNELLGTNEQLTVRLPKPGNYVAELRVLDPDGAVGRANIPLLVGNSHPVLRFLEPQDGDFFAPGKPLHYRVEVRDPEDGSSADYEEVFEGRSFVRARWNRNVGPDNIDPALAAMQRSDCFNCHATEQKIVGPPFLEVSERYRGQPAALEASVGRVLKGSTGVWGEIPMLPHEHLGAEEIKSMVRWIFDLRPGHNDASTQRGLTGLLAIPKDEKLRLAFLEASYTDLGRAPAGSLSGSTTVSLRRRRVEAEDAVAIKGAKVLGRFVGAIDHGHWLRFEHVNLSDTDRLVCRVASAGAGGSIEFRTDSPTGARIGQVEVLPTGGWDKWIEVSIPIDPLTKRCDVYVVFVNPGRGGLMNLDWVQFAER